MLDSPTIDLYENKAFFQFVFTTFQSPFNLAPELFKIDPWSGHIETVSIMLLSTELELPGLS